MREHREVQLNRLLESALLYCALGWSVIRLQPPVFGDERSGKKPYGKWKEQARFRLTEAELRRLFSDGIEANLGMVCGGVSGIIAVDADSSRAIDLVRTTLPPTPLISHTGGGGEHHLFKAPGFEVRPGAKLKGMPLDLRADDSYIVLPPSRHWSGKEYEWETEPTAEMLKSLPAFDPAWLGETRKYPEGQITVDPVESRIRLIRRAMRYIETMEPAVDGEGGSNRFFRAVAKLLVPEPSGFGLTVDEATPIIVAYNARAAPPFSDKEVEHKIKSVLARMGSLMQKGD